MPRDLIIKWAQGEFELVVSTYLLYELQAALSRPNFRKYITFPVLFQYVMWIADNASVGPDSTGSPRYTGDPGDDYLITLALDTEADLIVAVDRDLLDHRGTIPVPVDDPRSFLDTLAGY